MIFDHELIMKQGNYISHLNKPHTHTHHTPLPTQLHPLYTLHVHLECRFVDPTPLHPTCTPMPLQYATPTKPITRPY